MFTDLGPTGPLLMAETPKIDSLAERQGPANCGPALLLGRIDAATTRWPQQASKPYAAPTPNASLTAEVPFATAANQVEDLVVLQASECAAFRVQLPWVPNQGSRLSAESLEAARTSRREG